MKDLPDSKILGNNNFPESFLKSEQEKAQG